MDYHSLSELTHCGLSLANFIGSVYMLLLGIGIWPIHLQVSWTCCVLAVALFRFVFFYLSLSQLTFKPDMHISAVFSNYSAIPNQPMGRINQSYAWT